MKKLFKIADKEVNVEITYYSQDEVRFHYNGVNYQISRDSNFNDVYFDGQRSYKAQVDQEAVSVNGSNIEVAPLVLKRSKSQKGLKGDMTSPMPGKILKLNLDVGQSFKAGDAILVMEAMKMEHTIKATCDGVLTEYLVHQGQLVGGGVELFKFSKA